jgi:hypothetical protein
MCSQWSYQASISGFCAPRDTLGYWKSEAQCHWSAKYVRRTTLESKGKRLLEYSYMVVVKYGCKFDSSTGMPLLNVTGRWYRGTMAARHTPSLDASGWLQTFIQTQRYQCNWCFVEESSWIAAPSNWGSWAFVQGMICYNSVFAVAYLSPVTPRGASKLDFRFISRITWYDNALLFVSCRSGSTKRCVVHPFLLVTMIYTCGL